MESSCIYCGCGCRLDYTVSKNKITKVSGVKTDDVSEGIPCIKGLSINEVFDKNRILSPMIKKKGVFTTVALSEALNFIYEQTKNLSPQEVFFNTSGKITNENNFILQKFARICYKTSNIDSCCGRLCHLATVMGMQDVFGVSNITRMDYVKNTDCLLIIGSEPDKDYPVFYNKIVRNTKLKVINVNPFIKSSNPKDFLINIRPGSETCFLNGVVYELIKKGLTSSVSGFSVLKQKVSSYNSKLVSATCNIKESDYETLVKMIFDSKNFSVFHGMSLTQHMNSLENVHSLLNLVLLKKGKVLSLRGEINVQGAGDLGGIPGVLPTGDLSMKKDLEKCWGKVCENKGLNIIEALVLSPVKAAFITEFDPLKSLPDTERVIKSLNNTFIVYFGSYPTDTARMSNVVIPIASLLESEGSITNGERRIRKVNKVLKGPLELWEVLKLFSKNFKKSGNFKYKTSKDIIKELKDFVKAYNDISVDKLWNNIDQWADKVVKFERFMPESFEGLDDSASKKYPFILTTYRSKFAFLSDEITENSPTLTKNRERIGFYFNIDDARKLGLSDGDDVVVESQINSLVSKAFISDRIPAGIIGAYMHYSELRVNSLFPLNFDNESFTPNYKAVGVIVKKINI
ncbi:Formate dehydrogenase subunit alpha [Candidatus Tiddalikarchaeum anstoanum]|nr:Formate dehydrogenase subunit alpha [Candidatus Tiddalikarchaeum anstoanum]